jgi:hypothetical protein
MKLTLKLGIGCGIRGTEGNSNERVNSQRKNTALGNETAMSVQCLLFTKQLTAIKRCE